MSESSETDDSLVVLTNDLREEIRNDLGRAKLNVSTVVTCKSTHRWHSVRVHHLELVDALALAKLPASIRLSTVGATFVDALRRLTELEMEVRKQVEAVASIKLKIELLRVLDPVGKDDFDATHRRLTEALSDQLLLDVRERCLKELAGFMQVTGDVDTKRGALGEYLANFVDAEIDIVSRLSGYSVAPSGPQFSAYSMLQLGEKQVAVRDERLSKRDRSMTFLIKTIETDRILALATTAYRESAEIAALHAAGSTVAGTLEFAEACLAVMTTPTDGQPHDKRPAVDYRLEHCFNRVKKRLHDLSGYFQGQTMRHTNDHLSRAKALILKALERNPVTV
ncbi:MAG TPA: hypothetical protein V6C89_15230 [Drouetiella sp.]